MAQGDNGVDIYSERILDYYRNPKNKGKLAMPSSSASDSNLLCGDSLQVEISVACGKIKDICFDGVGCAVSTASMSMLTEMVKGKDLDYVIKLKNEDLLKKIGIDLGPVRLKCALLGLKVLKLAVYKYLGKSNEVEPKNQKG